MRVCVAKPRIAPCLVAEAMKVTPFLEAILPAAFREPPEALCLKDPDSSLETKTGQPMGNVIVSTNCNPRGITASAGPRVDSSCAHDQSVSLVRFNNLD